LAAFTLLFVLHCSLHSFLDHSHCDRTSVFFAV
jgi:hypothetical protein